jgi:hypothetical protein
MDLRKPSRTRILIMFLLLLSVFIVALIIFHALVGAICRIVKTDIENR